jgi:hypothetical protein
MQAQAQAQAQAWMATKRRRPVLVLLLALCWDLVDFLSSTAEALFAQESKSCE